MPNSRARPSRIPIHKVSKATKGQVLKPNVKHPWKAKRVNVDVPGFWIFVDEVPPATGWCQWCPHCQIWNKKIIQGNTRRVLDKALLQFEKGKKKGMKK